MNQALDCGVSLQKYPPRKDCVRAVSLQTGYLIKATDKSGCILYYLTQVDPRGEHLYAQVVAGKRQSLRERGKLFQAVPKSVLRVQGDKYCKGEIP